MLAFFHRLYCIDDLLASDIGDAREGQVEIFAFAALPIAFEAAVVGDGDAMLVWDVGIGLKCAVVSAAEDADDGDAERERKMRSACLVADEQAEMR